MSPIDYEQARFNMIEQQIRTWEVLDQRVLDLLSKVKREDFVPAALRALAFADLELPLPNGDRMWTPKMEARVVQELALLPEDSVLEIGTGSTPLLPPRFIEQLTPGGRVFAVVGELPIMTARLTRLEAPGASVATDLFETVVAPLRNALAPARFVF